MWIIVDTRVDVATGGSVVRYLGLFRTRTTAQNWLTDCRLRLTTAAA